MNGILESFELLIIILAAFAFGIGSGYAAIRVILFAFKPKTAPPPAIPLETIGTVGAVRQ